MIMIIAATKWHQKVRWSSQPFPSNKVEGKETNEFEKENCTVLSVPMHSRNPFRSTLVEHYMVRLHLLITNWLGVPGLKTQHLCLFASCQFLFKVLHICKHIFHIKKKKKNYAVLA